MIILGVDPGSLITGFAFVETDGSRFHVLEAGPVRLKKAGEIPQRLLLLATELEKRVRLHQPEVISLEKIFHGVNVQSALVLGYVRGVIMMLAARYEIPLAEYAPTEVKKAVTGYGRADKAQVQEMVRLLLNLRDVPKPADVADAMALAICHAQISPLMAQAQQKGPATRSWRQWQPPNR